MKRAKRFLDKKDYGRAILELRIAQQAMPKDAEPYFQLGLAHLSVKALPQAASAFRKAIELNPKHNGAQLKFAELMLASRNHELMEQAASRLQDILKSAPDDTEVLDAMAVAEMRLGKPDEAARRLEETLHRFPSHLQSSVMLVQVKLTQRDFKGAEDVLKRAIEKAPQSPQAAMALGEFYLLLNRKRDAEVEFQRARRLDPANGAVLLRLADLQTAAGRPSEAEQTIKTLSGLPEQRYKPLYGVYLFRSGKRDAALAEFERLAKNNPDDRIIRGHLVTAYMQMGKLGDAGKVLSAALKKNPRDAEALLQKAGLELKAGRPEQAAEDLRQALRFTPQSAQVHFALAVVYSAQGSATSERAELIETLKLDATQLQARLALSRNFLTANSGNQALNVLDEAPPTQRQTLALIIARHWTLLTLSKYKELRLSLDRTLAVQRHPELVLQDSYLRLKSQDYAGARVTADEVLRRNPEEVRAAEIIAESYASQKEMVSAVGRLSELAAGHPKSAPLQELLGRWQVRAGKMQEARAAFDAAKAADPKSVTADLALAELDRKENHADRACERLTAIVAVEPRNVSALLLLAGISEDAKDTQAAIARYRAILNIDGSNLYALNNLAYDLALADPDEALKFAQRAAEAAPDSASIQDTMGWVYYRKGNYQTAAKYLKSAVDKESTPKRQFHLALSYLKAGEQHLGRQMMQSALQRDPNLANTERGW